MDNLQAEREQRDRDIFVARARDLGAEVIVQAAASDDYLQLAQVRNMIRHGVDVLVVVPHDAAAIAPVVKQARDAGIRVIAYHRSVKGDLDLYISCDHERAGEMQAEYLTAVAPRGNYVYLGGAPTDENALLLRKGAGEVLEPLMEQGAIHMEADVMLPQWRPDLAEQYMEEVLRTSGGQVDGVIAASDELAGAALRALDRHGLTGQVPVVGYDADLAAVQAIVRGEQAMTVYSQSRVLATRAAEYAVAMARGETPQVGGTVRVGEREVPAYLLTPLIVDRTNIWETVIKDGVHRAEEVFGSRESPR